MDELKHKIELEEDTAEKTKLEKQYADDEKAYNDLDKLVTARREKWTKLQEEKGTRDAAKKKAAADKAKQFGDDVKAAKGEFETIRKEMTAKRKAYLEAIGNA